MKDGKNTYSQVVEQLRTLIDDNPILKLRIGLQLERCTTINSEITTNPVRTLDDLYSFLDHLLTSMPWSVGLRTQDSGHKTQDIGHRTQDLRSILSRRLTEEKEGNIPNDSLFRQIDQTIGYVYFLFGDLQYDEQISLWLKQYHKQWAKFLDCTDSWNEHYYNLLMQDPLFELTGDKYESPNKWHSWNDFFARRLNRQFPHYIIDEQTKIIAPSEGKQSEWIPIDEKSNLQTATTIKTTQVMSVSTLMADSPYRDSFAGGRFCHFTLDINHYHRFHAPVSGQVVDIREIDGQLTSGGKIIWDSEQQRYRYEQDDNIGYQMLEKRAVVVVRTQDFLVALVAVGVMQVGSVVINKDIYVGCYVEKGQEIGFFQFGGSDVIVLQTKSEF